MNNQSVRQRAEKCERDIGVKNILFVEKNKLVDFNLH
jgi:hypothetical protein